ncbi:MAG: type II toxin-antitoxin system RelE/ParE family toxin [Bacteroidetes bacterium]|nr:type II toxin-antitoxin system RelE/ParE family toxin [Bacteroidota bacterium]
MNIEFDKEELFDFYTGNYSGKQKFSEIILKGYKKVVEKMITAENINELSKIRGLNIEKLNDKWSARINDQYRVEFDFAKPDTLILLKISKHYE